MIGHREADICQAIKGQFSVWFRVINRLVLTRFFSGLGVILAVLDRAKKRETKRVGPHVQTAKHQGSCQAPFGPDRLHIAHLLQVLANRAAAHFGFVCRKLVTRTLRFDCIKSRFCRCLAGQHRIVVAFDARHVDHTYGTAQERHTRCHHFGHGLITAFRDRPRSIGHTFAALQQFRNLRMVFEALEFHVREEMWVFVIQMHHKTDIYLIFFKMIDEGTSTCVAAQWPPHSVGYFTKVVLSWVDLPDLFHANAKFLRLFAVLQIVLRNHLFCEGSAHTFRQEHIFAMQLHARLSVWTIRPVFFQTKDTSDDTLDFAIVAVDQLRAGHPREDFHAKLFRLFRHPATHVAHGHNIVAVVVHQRRHWEVWHTNFARFTQHVEVVFFYRRIQRRAFFFPIGNQCI
mmetsp:Transcript_27772/g.51764  ORF Transcript_27772/g.51764 Transcript_27772/m.51764 type:complete len:401 (+) Transcript_27772:1108-2310(+)